jgi:hypothetical protein
MKLSRLFYRLARMANDFEALSSGDTSRIARRGINKIIGRTIGRNIYLKGSGGRRKKRIF